MTYQNTAVFCPANLDGCGLWRMFFPHLNVKNSGFFFTQGRIPVDMITTHDVLCIQRLVTDGNRKFIELMRSLGMRVIYDLDDNLWQLDKSNPAKAVLEKYLVGLHEGDDYGLYACMSLADVVTVSTENLKRVVEREIGHIRNPITKKAIQVVVVENYIDHVLFKPNDEENEEIVIGWAGSNSHIGDVGEVWSLLPDILEKYKNVRMEFAGMPPPNKIRKHPRVKVREWVHIAEYAQQLRSWNWDIFLAPLAENKFNRAKSCIKQLEAGALGKVCLASYSTNYVEFANRAEEKIVEPGNIRWSLCGTTSQWKTRIEYLIENKQARIDLGQRFRELTLAKYDIAKESWRWQHACDLACQ